MGRKNITPPYDDEQVKPLIIKLFKDAIRDALSDGYIKVKERPIINPTVECIELQWYYNHDTNKIYIQYRFIGQTTYGLELEYVINSINQYFHANFHYESLTWPEIILLDDGVNERVDEFPLITPYTISYWMSLSGRYEFIIDEAVVNDDISTMEQIPIYEAEYYQRYQEIYELYYTTDFARFEEEIYALKKEYNIRVDKAPKHTFTEFIGKVRELNAEYSQVILTPEQKDQYIAAYYTLYMEHHDDPNFEDLVEALKTEYGIKRDLNSKVPEIFEKYKLLYKEFFGRDLYSVKIDLTDDGVFNFGDIDIGDETAVGDYDFSDTDEGTDPDTVAIKPYDFNRMVNTVNKIYLEVYEKKEIAINASA